MIIGTTAGITTIITIIHGILIIPGVFGIILTLLIGITHGIHGIPRIVL